MVIYMSCFRDLVGLAFRSRRGGGVRIVDVIDSENSSQEEGCGRRSMQLAYCCYFLKVHMASWNHHIWFWWQLVFDCEEVGIVRT